MKNYNVSGSSLRKPISFTHEEISTRARTLWEERGRPLDQDEVIWLEAERRLQAGDERDFADPKNLLNSEGDPSSRLEDRLREEVTPPARRSATSL